MKAAGIVGALGHTSRGGTHDYSKAPTFETRKGYRIGAVRHYHDAPKPGSRGPYREPEFWHYHETDGRQHCTRTINAADIVRAVSP